MVLYLFNIPMLLRPILSNVLISLDRSKNSNFYAYQMIVYKFCLFFAILVGFMMKKIEILINFDQHSKEDFNKQLKTFICRSRTYLFLFICDMLMSITISFLFIELDLKNDDELTNSIRILLVSYSIFWLFCFFYLFYLSFVFMSMAERLMRDILGYTGRELCVRRTINVLIGILFNIGQFKFFFINGIVLIIKVITHDDATTSWSVVVFMLICEYCETLLPLALGIFLIFFIETIGFVTEDDDMSSQVTPYSSDVQNNVAVS